MLENKYGCILENRFTDPSEHVVWSPIPAANRFPTRADLDTVFCVHFIVVMFHVLSLHIKARHLDPKFISFLKPTGRHIHAKPTVCTPRLPTRYTTPAPSH